MGSDERAELAAIAAELGVQTEYWDVHGHQHHAGVEQLRTVLAVLVGLGPTAGGGTASPTELRRSLDERRRQLRSRAVEPVQVRYEGDPLQLHLRLPSSTSTLELRLVTDDEVRATRSLDLHASAATTGFVDGRRSWQATIEAEWFTEAGIGRHRLTIDAGDRQHDTTVLCTPRRVPRLQSNERLWGLFAPLYSLWTTPRPDPTIGHLARLAEWMDGYGGKVLGTLPLLAGYLDRPFDPSPYTPVTRRWWNESYLDLAARPEVRASPEAVQLVEGRPASLDPREPFDAQDRAAHVRKVLAAVVHHARTNRSSLLDELTRFAAEHPDVTRYARFRAMVERTGTGWHGWDADARAGTLPINDDDVTVLIHTYGQWAMRRQLGRLNAALETRSQRLYLDLPVGVHGDGYDTWADQHLFAWGAAAGAPPDEFFTGGQNWGFPPMLPEASREQGHDQLAACLRAHMEMCGLLRLDHVMALHRLFWVPEGGDASDGVYVRYPADELFALLAIEAHRNDCAVVGEDLGTVPDEVRASMGEHGMVGMYVAAFAQPHHPGSPLHEPHGDVVASIGTHDTPTFAGWLAGDDIDRRRASGLLDDAQAEVEHEHRRTQVTNLRAHLERAGLVPVDSDRTALLEALLALLGSSDVPVVLSSLDDLTGTVEPQNVPGTPTERPNWVLRLDRSLAELEGDPELRTVLARLQDARLGSWERATR